VTPLPVNIRLRVVCFFLFRLDDDFGEDVVDGVAEDSLLVFSINTLYCRSYGFFLIRERKYLQYTQQQRCKKRLEVDSSKKAKYGINFSLFTKGIVVASKFTEIEKVSNKKQRKIVLHKINIYTYKKYKNMR